MREYEPKNGNKYSVGDVVVTLKGNICMIIHGDTTKSCSARYNSVVLVAKSPLAYPGKVHTCVPNKLYTGMLTP